MKLFLQVLLLAIAVGPLALVLTAVVLAKRERRALLGAVLARRCPSCDGVLTEHSVRIAEESWTKYVEALRRRHPSTRFRLIRPLDAVCERCGKPLKLDASRALRVVTVDFALEAT